MKNAEEPKVEQSTPSSRVAAKDTFRILIMDSPENVEQLKRACQDVGHSVVGASSINEAFAFLDGQDHADVIVCAAYLEDESLFDFLQRLRTNPIHKESAFLTLALGPGPIGIKMINATEMAGRVLGADAFVHMPIFDPDILIEQVKKLLPQMPALERDRIKALDDLEN